MTDANRFSLSYGLLKTSVLYFHGVRTVRQGLLIANMDSLAELPPRRRRVNAIRRASGRRLK